MKTLLSTGVALLSFLCLNPSLSKAARRSQVVTAFASFSEGGAIFVAEDQFFRNRLT